jgi:hypothetical protein
MSVPIACLSSDSPYGEYSMLFNQSGGQLTSSARTNQNLWTTPGNDRSPISSSPATNRTQRPTPKRSSNVPVPANVKTTRIAPLPNALELQEQVSRLEVRMLEKDQRNSIHNFLLLSLIRAQPRVVGPEREWPDYIRPTEFQSETPPHASSQGSALLAPEHMEILITEAIKAIEKEYVLRLDAVRLRMMKDLEEQLGVGSHHRQNDLLSAAQQASECITHDAVSALRIEIMDRLGAMEAHFAQESRKFMSEAQQLWSMQSSSAPLERSISGSAPKRLPASSAGNKQLFNLTDITYLVMMPRPPNAILNILDLSAWLLEFPDVATMRVNTREAERRLYFFSSITLNPHTALPRLDDFFERTSYASVMGSCPEGARMYNWICDTTFRLRGMGATGGPAGYNTPPTGMGLLPPEGHPQHQDPTLSSVGGVFGGCMDAQGRCVCGNVLPDHLRKALPDSKSTTYVRK